MITAAAVTRAAVPADNDALLALADACPMHGAISLQIDRRPDFFAFSALEPEWSSVEVVESDDGDIAGCVAVARRSAWVNGVEIPISYVGDLKVHPSYRGSPVADVLTRRAAELSASLVGDTGMVLCSTLAGNTPMERRALGGGDRPVLRRIATVRAHAVPLLSHPGVRPWRRTLRVTHATPRDIEEMAALWRTTAPLHQLASPLDTAAIAQWMALPGVSYLLARAANGRLAGFLALWDQRDCRQLRILRYSPALARVRAVFNLAAPLVGATRLPRIGEALRHVETMQLCVAANDLNALRTLALAAHHELRGSDAAFFTLSLDARDPLCGALRGLWSQPTDIDIRVTSPMGAYAGPPLDGRPVHYETALV